MLDKLLPLAGGLKVYAIVAAVAFTMGGASAWRVMTWQDEAEAGKQAVATLEYVQSSHDIAFDIGIKLDADFSEITDRTIIIIKEVPKYVTAKANAQCPISRGFVRLWNDTAEGRVPASNPGNDVDAPSDVALSTVSEAHTADSDDYQKARAVIVAWHEWYAKQKALAEGHTSK